MKPTIEDIAIELLRCAVAHEPVSVSQRDGENERSVHRSAPARAQHAQNHV
jgi:hypothetical protein